MKQPIRLLLPADGSVYTRRALDFVLSRQEWWREPPFCVLLHVESPVGTALARSYLSRDMLDSYYAEQSEAVLAPARASLQAAGLQLEAHHRHGDAAAQIVKFVREHEIDLVMMGSHGHTALSGMALGSVTTKVIASSSIPVLIVR